MSDPDMKELDALMAEVSRDAPNVPEHLMSAVLRDAAIVQPRPVEAPTSLWDRVMEAIGGWPALGGMAAAGVAGLWLGVSPPVALESATVNFLGTTETVDLFGNDLLSGFAVEEQAQ